MLTRLARMGLSEIGWRGRAALRIGRDRLGAAAVTPRWDRRALAGALTPGGDLAAARAALARASWMEAQRLLARHFARAPQRFALAPASRAPIAAAIEAGFPEARLDAAARADRIVAGRYDLLGYRGLTFHDGSRAVDWHRDPVHRRRAPDRFWSRVPYLDPACGDHKIIWELNRHQHWLVLGRAFWLTGDARYRERCLFELASWLEANPPLTGINWASMLELGLRSLSWLWALAFLAEGGEADERPWLVDLLLALDRQLEHVERNLSYYFSPNTHLIGEALALYVAGRTLPELVRSGRREALGRRVLLEEIRRQIASDGGHCERSTHYHRYTLDFYLLALLVARVTDDPAAREFQDAVARLAGAARLLADDRGRLPHLGDDDGGVLFPIAGRDPDDIRDSLWVAGALVGDVRLQIGPAPEEAHWLLAHPRLARSLDRVPIEASAPPSGALADTGYYIARSPHGDHLVIDGGPHGYLNGGHAHADALALTLTVAGTPFLVDAGTGAYTVEAGLRDRLRSTQMHNSLVVDDRSQSIPDGPFSWAHTAHARVGRWHADRVLAYFEGLHDGYGPIEHHRRVLMRPADVLIVADLVSGAGSHAAAVYWHVDPRWEVTVRGASARFASGDQWCELIVPRGRIETFSGDSATGLGWHAPVYGRLEPSTTLRVTRQGALPYWITSIFGLDARNPILAAECLDVSAAPGAPGQAAAFRLLRRASTDVVVLAPPTRRHAGTTWRSAGFESDARVFFCRTAERRPTHVAFIDGSVARAAGPSAFEIDLLHRRPAVHVDLPDEGLAERRRA